MSLYRLSKHRQSHLRWRRYDATFVPSKSRRSQQSISGFPPQSLAPSIHTQWIDTGEKRHSLNDATATIADLGYGYLEKLAKLVFRGTLRGLSIEGRVINQRLTLQLIISLPPNPHPIEVFRCAHEYVEFQPLVSFLLREGFLRLPIKR